MEQHIEVKGKKVRHKFRSVQTLEKSLVGLLTGTRPVCLEVRHIWVVLELQQVKEIWKRLEKVWARGHPEDAHCDDKMLWIWICREARLPSIA